MSSNIIRISSKDTSQFEKTVENFKDSIEFYCERFTKVLLGLESDLRDPKSKELLQYGHGICAEIRSVLNPSILVLELVHNCTKELNSDDLSL